QIGKLGGDVPRVALTMLAQADQADALDATRWHASIPSAAFPTAKAAQAEKLHGLRHALPCPTRLVTDRTMPAAFLDAVDLEAVAARVGTPFYLYDAATLRQRIADVKAIADGDGIQARYAMKACSLRRVLEVMRDAGVWIDAVSGNEVL